MTGTALAAATRDELRAFWSDRLGVDGTAFERGGVTVGTGGAGAGAEATAGVELLVPANGDARLVGAPVRLVDAMRERAADLAAVDPGDPAAVGGLVSEAAEATAAEETVEAAETADGAAGRTRVVEVHGPAFCGYADAGTFEPVADRAGATTRPLTPDDRAAYGRFRESVPDPEWSAGGPAFDPGRTVGRLVDGEIVAAAGYEVRAGRIAHVAVVARPDARSEGHGRAVVSRATADALDAGLLPQYRTLDAWPNSVALAEGLGYERFGTSLFVELG